MQTQPLALLLMAGLMSKGWQWQATAEEAKWLHCTLQIVSPLPLLSHIKGLATTLLGAQESPLSACRRPDFCCVSHRPGGLPLLCTVHLQLLPISTRCGGCGGQEAGLVGGGCQGVLQPQDRHLLQHGLQGGLLPGHRERDVHRQRLPGARWLSRSLSFKFVFLRACR